jgi:hypothetical protein
LPVVPEVITPMATEAPASPPATPTKLAISDRVCAGQTYSVTLGWTDNATNMGRRSPRWEPTPQATRTIRRAAAPTHTAWRPSTLPEPRERRPLRRKAASSEYDQPRHRCGLTSQIPRFKCCVTNIGSWML